MILVAGGTGRLGRAIVHRLAAAGTRVRVLTRDAARARDLDVEVVVGDVRDASCVAAAVRGCVTVVSAIHGFAGPGRPSPEAIDRKGNLALIDAARSAGVGHFVLVSVHGAAATHPMTLHRAKHAAEVALRASGLRFSIVRPTSFMETWVDVLGGPLAKDGAALVFGPGVNPVNFIGIDDVAALVVARVRTGGGDEIIEIVGPENLGFTAFAERLIAARGTPATIRRIPLPALRLMSVLARPFSPVFARMAAAAVLMNTRDETFAGSTGIVGTTTLKDVLAARSIPALLPTDAINASRTTPADPRAAPDVRRARADPGRRRP